MKFDQALASWRNFLYGRPDEAVLILRQIEAHEQNAGSINNAAAIRRLLQTRPHMVSLEGVAAPDSMFLSQPIRTLDSLILAEELQKAISAVIAEWKNRAALQSHGLPPRNTIFLKGPSGNGKTAGAQAIAHAVNLPFAFVRYESLIDSHMGETGRNLGKLFEFANKVPCFLFFDEADSVICSRTASVSAADKETNRATNLILMKLDLLSPNSMCAFATNMPESMDEALLRRIGVSLEFGAPTPDLRNRMMDAMEIKWPIIRSSGWRDAELQAVSFAGIESAAMDAARCAVLSQADVLL